jgi:hypothetical protein
MEQSDPYREYPLRIFGFANALVRPWKDRLPTPLYQSSFALMHTYFLTNAYDYANHVDSTSWISSFGDCMTWHFAASWVLPALVVDNSMRLLKKLANGNRVLPIFGAYAFFPFASLVIDRATNWYFYGFWSAGSKDRPRL